MPEGDTLHRTAATLHRALAGRTVVRFETVLPKLARVDVDRPIAGRTVEAVTAAGKHLLMTFSGQPLIVRPERGGRAAAAESKAGPLVLRTHLRMNGTWHLYRPGARWQRPRSAMRIVVETADAVAVAFDVPVAELLDRGALARQRDLTRMGPDLLAPDFDAAEAARRLRARPDAEVGEALLDQAAVAGAGNVFKSEILFVAGVHPARRVRELPDVDVDRIVAEARRLLLANVRAGAPSGRRTTGRWNPGERLFVYGRGGEPCRRCGAPVAFARQGIHARVTYFCPRCQPAP
ncbi:DNA-formamidopyrimidine glycosylase family protein [Anaeromyxobacter oryzae]|uniref:DNA-(apurinic or apyrimidinic site) lyase n=1 Tax=Anaeromyxobacter oryzae TaxID=2918170 RepID=A0ABM7WNR3_9BACT|nr:DNA-formamidopyrimidine glycosylase family protein [Anaeromyxobacter oryzae]BDG01104.1 putative endonuclease 8 2 [Anaeromyxobacter oryzae]